MGSIQFALQCLWDKLSQLDKAQIQVPRFLLEDLEWWNNKGRLNRGISFKPEAPELMLLSDSSLEG